MATRKFISYLRCSTARQGVSGLGIEGQREAVASYLNGGNWKLVAEFVEVESGKKNNRPELAKALSACRVHNATLVVSKLDRLARNAAFLLNLRDAGVEFVAVDMPFANRLTVGIMAMVAEEEGKMISARTKTALQMAKARGTKLGCPRPITKLAQVNGNKASAVVRHLKSMQWLADIAPVVEEAVQESGALRRAADYLNKRGIPTRRGGSWTGAQVWRVLKA